LADVVAREGADVVVYDEEFTASVDRALAEKPSCVRILGWVEHSNAQDRTVADVVSAHTGERLTASNRAGKLILLTSVTEAGMIATATPADLRAAPDTAGTPAVGTEIRILDDHFHDLPVGETGQIFVKNSTQFDGYTSGVTRSFHDGFMASGDVGYCDTAGRLFVVGRDDEMIVSGGENVYPIEVEKMLTAHPEV
jgi:acyl-CoA synthetase (AMP-forming)/AMP-acid ligase II